MPFTRPRDYLAEAEADPRAEVSLRSILNFPETCQDLARALANIDHVYLAEADPRAEVSLSSILNSHETCQDLARAPSQT